MERKRKRLASPLQRKVHIDGEEWTYSPGHTTFILNPARDNKISVRQIDFFPGLTWDTLERAEDKGYAHQFAVTPSVIKEWIETKMLGKVFKESLRVRQIVSVTKRGGKVSLTNFGGSDLLACTVKWPDGKTRVLALSEEEVRQLRSRCEVIDTEPIPAGVKRIWMLKNSGGPSFMVVAKKESVVRLALHFKVVKDIKNLGYSDITDVWEQYPKEAIKEVCLKAPEGVAGVEMDATSFTWTVCDEEGKMWNGTKGQFDF